MNKIKKRNYYYRMSKRYGRPEDFKRYKNLRNSVVLMLRQSKARFFEILDPSEGKSFWKAVKYLSKSQAQFPSWLRMVAQLKMMKVKPSC